MAMKENKGYWILLVILLAWLVVGCAASHTRFVEVKRSAIADNPQVKAKAPYIFSNRYSATNADVRIYEGYLQKTTMMGNVNGRSVIYDDYVDKFNVGNAFGPNDATVVHRSLDPSKRYTALVVVNWGGFGKIYDIYYLHLRPTKDTTRTVWTDSRGWGSSYVNDYVEVSGTDTPAYNNKLDLTWTVYPNEVVRRALVGRVR